MDMKVMQKISNSDNMKEHKTTREDKMKQEDNSGMRANSRARKISLMDEDEAIKLIDKSLKSYENLNSPGSPSLSEFYEGDSNSSESSFQDMMRLFEHLSIMETQQHNRTLYNWKGRKDICIVAKSLQMIGTNEHKS